jgi:hypothetical protein
MSQSDQIKAENVVCTGGMRNILLVEIPEGWRKRERERRTCRWKIVIKAFSKK